MTPPALDPGAPGGGELLLSTCPPRLPEHLLPRERLSCEDPRWRDAPFALVQAPAGFGKTMLLAQWRREHLARGRVVAWLSASARQAPARLVQALALAVRMSAGRPAFGRTLLDRPPAVALEGMTAWLAELAQSALDVVLIVDEAERLGADALALLAYALRNAPPNLRVAVAARSGCALGLDDLVDYGRCAVVGASLLRFEPAETIALVRHRLGAEASRDQGAWLNELADGWPLGTQLLLSSVGSAGALEFSLSALSAQDRAWQARFGELLLSCLDAADTALMVRLSFTEDMHPGLCQALVGDEDKGAPQRLARLARETPLFAAAEPGPWLRMHSLAREVLRPGFDALPAQERATLHARAAQWLAAQGRLDAAAAHALAADQRELACELVERNLFESLMQRHRDGSALEWLSRLPAAELDRRPRLLLAAAWALSMGERHEQAEALVVRVLARPGLDAGTRCECDLIRNGATMFADDPDRFAALFRPWAQQPPLTHPMLLQVHANRGAYQALLDGDPALARQRLQQAPAPAAAGGWSLPGFGRWGIAALSHYAEGRVQAVDELLAPVLAAMDAEVGRRGLFAAMLATVRAAALFERNAVAEAAALLAHRLDVLERSGLPESLVLGFLTLARVAVAEGDEARALELLQGLYAVGTARCLPRLWIVSLAEQARLHAHHYRAEACADVAGRIAALLGGPGLPQGPLWRRGVEPLLALSHGYAAIAARQWRRAPEPLARAEALARQLGQARLATAAMGLRALALDHGGERARPLLREAADTARSLGLVRLLADAHPALGALVRDAAAWEQPAALPVAPPPVAVPGPRFSPSQALTPKEHEVLTLLARNLTNREIALALEVSAETVKWHVKNLLAKLNAQTRRHAVQRARMLGLLE